MGLHAHARRKRPRFTEKLKAEAPGILKWALKGLRDLLANGKKPPACGRIEDATQQYRQEMDIVGRKPGQQPGNKTDGCGV